MTSLPPDLPDEGPTVPARFRVYPEPVNGAFSWGTGLMAFGWIAVACIAVGLMIWGR